MIKPENNTFHTLSIQTTYQCNMKCANCYLGHMLNNPDYADIDLKVFEDSISKLPGKCDIRLIGAEPTMNDNLFELIRITRKYNHRPSLLTNGLKLGQEDYVIKMCDKYNRTTGITFPIMMRIKSVGKMGNHLDTYTYNINELINIAKENFGDFEPVFEIDGYKEKNTCTYKFQTEIGVMYGKCTDWTIDDDGLPDRGSKRRGILTKEGMIMPFFEFYEEEVNVKKKK